MRIALIMLSAMAALSASADDIVLTDMELSEAVMDSSRGGQYIKKSIVIADSDQQGMITNSSVGNNSMTGNNVISPGALTGITGVNSVIQNTGNNVLIQNSTVVNLTLK